MVLLGTLVLAPVGGRMAPLGKWLHAPEHPFRDTLTAEGRRAEIVGAALLNWDEVKLPMLEVLIERRERAPIIGTDATRLWVVDREDGTRWGGLGRWVRLDELRVGESVRIPEWDHTRRVCVSWGRVKQIRPAPGPDHLWPGTPRLCGTLRLSRGGYSFATPGAFVHT